MAGQNMCSEMQMCVRRRYGDEDDDDDTLPPTDDNPLKPTRAHIFMLRDVCTRTRSMRTTHM